MISKRLRRKFKCALFQVPICDEESPYFDLSDLSANRKRFGYAFKHSCAPLHDFREFIF